jgi:hypothetical protein
VSCSTGSISGLYVSCQRRDCFGADLSFSRPPNLALVHIGHEPPVLHLLRLGLCKAPAQDSLELPRRARFLGSGRLPVCTACKPRLRRLRSCEASRSHCMGTRNA